MAVDALRLAGVDAWYADSHVLHGIDFNLPEGSTLAVLGRNGAGKTTCINAIMGMQVRRRGSLSLFGSDISMLTTEAVALTGIGLVPQGRRVFKSLSVRENLTIAARPGSWNLARVFEAFPRLREREGQGAGTLSGGEQQLLAICRALMTNPRLLLLDEPSEGLAPQMVEEVQRTVLLLKNEGMTVVLVEQNTRFALELADSAAILNTGRLAFFGDVAELRRNPSLIELNLGVN